jgi:hypothetical protein
VCSFLRNPETERAHEVNQTVFNTCTVTSMQYELARDNPAELARLVAGLAGPTGRVDMRGGGELELQADALTPAALRERSFSEALFQTSLSMPNAPVLLSYDTNGSEPDGGHAVTFVRVEGDRVFFRNPWGPNNLAPGATQRDGSRVEDPATGLYSFSMEELRARISGLTALEPIARSAGLARLKRGPVSRAVTSTIRFRG